VAGRLAPDRTAFPTGKHAIHGAQATARPPAETGPAPTQTAPAYRSPADGDLGWQTAVIPLPVGVKTIEIWVADDEDDVVDTALLIDNIRTEIGLLEGFEGQTIGQAPDIPQSGFTGNVTVQTGAGFSVPEPAPAALLALVAGALARRRRRWTS
jgi:hypothetical protein